MSSSTKPPKGTRDLPPENVYLRTEIFNKLVPIYEKYGGLPIQTPILERMDVVKNLYGEEFDKLVFTIDNDNAESEQLLLRYDLTVPFVRFLANNGIVLFKRYQMGPVYRRDNVNISKGRLREFNQADFDIIGNDNGNMVQETEILNLLIECLSTLLKPNTFRIYVNSREILLDMLSVIGIRKESILSVCSTLDKLDKFKEDEWVQRTTDELIEKGIKEDKINDIIKFIGSFRNLTCSNVEKLLMLKGAGFVTDDTYNKMSMLFEYLDSTDASQYIEFTPTLARGLDYYTGLIYEATYNDKKIIESSIAAGGRYNELIGKLSNKKEISAIGMSIGIERIVTILEKQNIKIDLPSPYVFVASVGKNMTGERLKLVCQLRKNGIYAEMSYSNNPKMKGQLDRVFENGIPYMIVIGENEIEKNTVMLKDIEKKEQKELDRLEAIEFLKKVRPLT